MSRQPDWRHQFTVDGVTTPLRVWSEQTGRGYPISAPGLIFAEDEAVAPDLVWISAERFSRVAGPGPHLHSAPDLVVEVLSPGTENQRRDRELKLKLYSRRGVLEYWMLDRQDRAIEVYRREGGALRLVATLRGGDMLESPLLPGFSCAVDDLFAAPG